MDDLISRAALLKECAECQKTDPRFEERGWASHFLNDAGEPSTEWYCVEDMIENAPAVDAVPVVHGRWIRYSEIFHDPEYTLVKCSVCGGESCCDADYCPNCGAKMDGERRDES